MNTCLRFTLCFVLCLQLLGPCNWAAAQTRAGAPESVGVSSERLDRLSRTLQGYVDGGFLSGSVALVIRHGKIAYSRAFGFRDREAADPMKEDTIFRIASQSKAIVSTGILMLQEEGRLLISDPVSKYLPEYQETRVAEGREGETYEVVPAKRPITIRHLLTHTAGIDYGNGPAAKEWAEAGIQGWYFAHRTEPIRETVRRMASLPMAAHPGEKYVYGYNTDILGAVIEEVSGQPLDVFLTQKIFEPLGMRDTYFYLPPEKAGRLAVVYSLSREEGLTRTPDVSAMVGQGEYVTGPRTSFSGGAGLLSTSHDYARFLLMIANGGELDGARLLSPTSVRLMLADHVGGMGIKWQDGQGFGLAFSVVTDLGGYGRPSAVGEFSWGGAYHSAYWVSPEDDLVVVYFTQLIPAGPLDDFGKLRALVYQAIVNE